jgi:hypothetical protein
LLHLIEQALGRQFTRAEVAIPTSEPALSQFTSAATSSMMMTSPGHRVRTSQITSDIFAALWSAGHYRAVYIDDMQKVLGSYNPEV